MSTLNVVETTASDNYATSTFDTLPTGDFLYMVASEVSVINSDIDQRAAVGGENIVTAGSGCLAGSYGNCTAMGGSLFSCAFDRHFSRKGDEARPMRCLLLQRQQDPIARFLRP